MNHPLFRSMPLQQTQTSNGSYVSKYLGTDVSGYFGAVPIAVIERPFSNGSDLCAIVEDHESLIFASVNYTGASPSFQFCNSDADCECGYINGAWGPGLCGGGICRGGDHLNAMLSSISRTAFIPGVIPLTLKNHAAEASLHVMQDKAHDSCDPSKLVPYLDELAIDGVALNVRGQHCGDDEPVAAAIYDFYAREDGRLFVQSSGNMFPSSGDDTVRCLAANEICVGGTNRNGSDGYEDDSMMSGGSIDFRSRWRNVEIQEKVSDREKPDVVAMGNLWVMEETTLGEWREAEGTSFAAASIAGMMAVVWEYCADIQSVPVSAFANQLMWRSRVRTTANPDHALEDYYPEFAYPTPGAALSGGGMVDSRAGAGIGDFETLIRFCSDKQPSETGDPEGGPFGGPFVLDLPTTVSSEDSEWEPISELFIGQAEQTAPHWAWIGKEGGSWAERSA
jgi:hypothetical protein